MTSTHKNLTFSKFLLASFAALALTGCLPVPIYDVTPSTARAGSVCTGVTVGSCARARPDSRSAHARKKQIRHHITAPSWHIAMTACPCPKLVHWGV